jgi:hypothetical protein
MSCGPKVDPEPNPTKKWFPETPQNITGLNTEFDDFNSALIRDGKAFNLYYSTNKNSEGGDYDISSAFFEIFEDYETDEVEFEIILDRAMWAEIILPLINTGYNELGPFSFEWVNDPYDTHGNLLFLCADDSAGNFDIKFTNINISQWAQGGSNQQVPGAINANVLNSASNDYYPTVNKNFSEFYFCSNRNGDYDIFNVEISNPVLTDWLETGEDEPTVSSILSSGYDDKCPYINGNLMVFASDRENGFGEFDLWYTIWANGEWSEPVNFGPGINTEYDEYRPATEYFEDSKNDLMFFSSNRPGGSGGFDLYFTGIEKMIE